MIYNLDGKVFKPLNNADNGEVDDQTRFYYHQQGSTVWADYSGGPIHKGHLIATMQTDGSLDMRYHHLNHTGVLMIGTCISIPELLDNGKLLFHESWQWLCDDFTKGNSTIVEL